MVATLSARRRREQRRGARELPLPVPNDPSLRGAELRRRGLVLDPGGAFQGALAFTSGVHVAIGS
jgi:hypothetical protein